LKRPEKEIKLAAIEAVATLAAEQYNDVAQAHIQQSAAGADETVARAAARAVQQPQGRASGQFAATGTLGVTPTVAAAASSSTPQPAAAPPPPPVSETARTLLIDGADVAPSAPDTQTLDISLLEPGDMIEGRYKFVQKIGKGAFGTVL